MPELVSCLWAEDGVAPIDWALACRELAARDRGLGAIIERVGGDGFAGRPSSSTFESLAHSIVYQQLSGKAAETIFGRFRALYNGAAFPAPETVLKTPHKRLRSAGLSEAKALAIKDLAAHAARGEIPDIATLRGMQPDAVIERLTVVRGIGRWTVEMLLMFRVGHPDVLPVHDLGIRKGFARIQRKRELPEAAVILRRGGRGRPHRPVGRGHRC